MRFRALQVVDPTRVALDFETDDGEVRRFHFTADELGAVPGRGMRYVEDAFGAYLAVPINGSPLDFDVRDLTKLVVSAVTVAQCEFPIDEHLDEVIAERQAESQRRWDENAPIREARAARLRDGETFRADG